MRWAIVSAAAPGMLSVSAVFERLRRHSRRQHGSQASGGVKPASHFLRAKRTQCVCDVSGMRPNVMLIQKLFALLLR